MSHFVTKLNYFIFFVCILPSKRPMFMIFSSI